MAKVGADLVLLDASRGEYMCVPQGASTLSLDPDSDAIAAPDAEAGRKLQQAGFAIWTADHAGAPRRPPPALPTRDLPERSDVATTLQDLRDVAWAYGAMTWCYRGRSFGAIVAQAQRLADARGRHDLNMIDIDRDVKVFRRWLPWAPFQGECLVRSFMLLLFLHRRGRGAAWVFGVRTWPFSAHCWLQVDDTVLDDHSGHLAGYMPIMAITPRS
ncbi:lasso peptide biosynthesis B2 protein [Phenylobacterium sp.]|uniref:lasso peptide biosynthesis B2 protein n=1 Tax=Phenylobacterium sp. TaxID=1871053 RepID=UPI0026011B55|nr:lasso peptide biosynthesis B2 protein [Phenylobacterium sp.]